MNYSNFLELNTDTKDRMRGGSLSHLTMSPCIWSSGGRELRALQQRTRDPGKAFLAPSRTGLKRS